MSWLPDKDLAAAAADAIDVLTTIPQESIKVSARDGWVRLEGKVSGAQQRALLENISWHLPGVQGVINLITIEAALRYRDEADPEKC
jgi:osmotically-inducible protein OsmY